MEEKKTILIADDEEQIRDILTKLFQSKNYRVLTAKNGNEVIEIIEKHEIPDLLILDIMMPEKSGYEVTEYLRSNPLYATIPIIMLTALYAPEKIVQGLTIGADDYITKPFDLNQLLKRVENIINRGNISKKVIDTISHYKKLIDNSNDDKKTYEKIQKIYIIPYLLELLKKYAKDGFSFVYISFNELLNQKDIYGWEIINNTLKELKIKMEKIIKRTFNKDLYFIRNILVSDFIIVVKKQENISALDKKIYQISKDIIGKIDKSFLKIPFLIILKSGIFKLNDEKNIEKELFQFIFDTIRFITNEREQRFNIIKEKIKKQQYIYRLLNITDIENKKRGVFLETKVNDILICEIIEHIIKTENIIDICENIFKYINNNYNEAYDFYLPISDHILNSEFLFLLRNNKHLKNIIFTLDDTQISKKIFYITEYISMIKDMGFNIALFNFGTYTSNIDSIFSLKPKSVFLHPIIYWDLDKNFIKQDLIKSLVNFEKQIDLKIIGDISYKDKLLPFGVNYFMGE